MIEYYLEIGEEDSEPTVISGLPSARTRSELAQKLGTSTVRFGAITYPLREVKQRSSLAVEEGKEDTIQACLVTGGGAMGAAVGKSIVTTVLGAFAGYYGNEHLSKVREEECNAAALFNVSLDPDDTDSVASRALRLWFESMDSSYTNLCNAVGMSKDSGTRQFWSELFEGKRKVPSFVSYRIPREYFALALKSIREDAGL